MFERFTPVARAVVLYAQEEARRGRRRLMDTDDLWIALASTPKAASNEALSALGIRTSHQTASAGARLLRRSSPGHIPMTGDLKGTIEHALRIASSEGSSHIRSQHLLLALVMGDHGAGSDQARRAGVTAANVRANVTILEPADPPTQPDPGRAATADEPE